MTLSPRTAPKAGAGRALLGLAVALQVALMAGCGRLPTSATSPNPSTTSTSELAPLSVTPQTSSVFTGGTVMLRATGSGSASVTWSIDGAGSGNATVGTVSPQGLYTPPPIV